MEGAALVGSDLDRQKAQLIEAHYPYKMVHHSALDTEVLHYVRTMKRSGRKHGTFSNCWIMCDTETSKKPYTTPIYDDEGKELRRTTENHVVAWTVSVRAYGINLFTVWGHRPSTMVDTITRINKELPGDYTYMYFHNMSYDWTFLRKFMMQSWGKPVHQLNTKSHYPVMIEFSNGITFRDSLILAQRSLDKWSKDLNVDHQKAVGKWDYDKLRNQREPYDAGELEYIEHDTLAGVECLDATAQELNKTAHSIPLTATGIPRLDVRRIGKDNRAKDRFLRMALDWVQYQIAEMVYHGGYTHANRYVVGWIIENVLCLDFASSYPFCMLSEKYPMEAFTHMSGAWPVEKVLAQKDDYAFMLHLRMMQPRLKSYAEPMPVLQRSKCTHIINPVIDNGRVLCAAYADIWVTEQDLDIIVKQYDADMMICADVYAARKEYLPRWFTDYIFECYTKKCLLKNGDPVQYSMAKAKVNSLYGMCVQKSIRDEISEDYNTGEYTTAEKRTEEEYNKYLKNRNNILPYQWGVWVTAYALHNLFELGECCGDWVYSDTDSIYGKNWDMKAVNTYNERCKDKLRANGYGAVNVNGKEFWLGCAEVDKKCSEFKVLGAKRYAYRDAETNKLKITVAGVPKKGAACLQDDINRFEKGFVFPGEETGKLLHSYYYTEEIYTDTDGNETGDSIDLSPCAYELDKIDIDDDYIIEEEYIQVYEEY